MIEPDAIADSLSRIAKRLEESPSRPFSQTEIDELRDIATSARRLFQRVETLGWLGKWALWILGTLVIVFTQWDTLRGRFWP